MPVATPPATPAQTETNPNPTPAASIPPGNISQRPAAPSQRSGLSGDTEPLGKEGEYVMLEDPSEGGALFAIDLTEPEASVDRFAAVPVTGGADSSTFVFDSAPSSPGGSAKAVSLPEGFTAIAEMGYHSDGYPWRVRCEKDGSIMAYVPEGVFVQGKNGRESNAAPEHGVALDAYYIDFFEVTAQQYADYRESARTTKRPISEPARKTENFNEPVTGLSWSEARAYATWTGRELPTEAEWEKAARGTQGFDFPWGDGPALWHRPRRQGQIDAVGSFRGDVSPFGVYDLAGNVREWCNDLYHEQYYKQLARESGATARNPTGPRSSSGASQRVVKGGDPRWFVWTRAGGNMNDRAADVGFRCVWRPPAAKKR